MSMEKEYDSTPPMSLTLSEVIKYARNSKKEYCCVCKPLFNVPLGHVIPDELYLILRITDVLWTNVLDHGKR